MIYNIVFATDQNYIQHLDVAIRSLLENNKNSEFKIFIINGGIESDEWKKLIKVSSQYNSELINITIDDFLFEKLVTNHHFTKANYYRLFIPQFIEKGKVLYLDADIVVNGSIVDLFKTDIDKYYIAAVENPGFNRHKELKMHANSQYFNSGVMLINIDKWKEFNLTQKVIDFVHNNPSSIKFVDQCGLNAVIDGRWKKLSLKFNQQAVIFEKGFEEKQEYFSEEELKQAKEKPIIVHYTGSSKPWQFRNKHPYKHLYWKYLRMTPFRRYIPKDLTILNLIKSLAPKRIKEFTKNVIK